MGKSIKVHFVPAGHALLRDGPEDDAPGIGRSDGLQQFIAVEKGQPLDTEQDCLLHEVLHHVEYAMKLDVPEEIIEKLSSGLLAVIKDNPQFLPYLQHNDK